MLNFIPPPNDKKKRRDKDDEEDGTEPEVGFSLTHYQSRLLTSLEKKAFENIVGKGENAGIQHFLLFPQFFLLFLSQISIFESLLFKRLRML